MRLNEYELERVSIETAKELKNKGFNIPVDCFYLIDPKTPTVGVIHNVYNGIHRNHNDIKYDNFRISCPSQELVKKWFRDIHNMSIEINIDEHMWRSSLSIINPNIIKAESIYNITPKFTYFTARYDTYEECLELAIKRCITLIGKYV